jgi:hypothetical protein
MTVPLVLTLVAAGALLPAAPVRDRRASDRRASGDRADVKSREPAADEAPAAEPPIRHTTNQGTKLGWQYLREGDYARAERIFQQVLDQDKFDMKAWQGYNLAYGKRKAQDEGKTDDTPIPSERSERTDRGDAGKPRARGAKAGGRAAARDAGSGPEGPAGGLRPPSGDDPRSQDSRGDPSPASADQPADQENPPPRSSSRKPVPDKSRKAGPKARPPAEDDEARGEGEAEDAGTGGGSAGRDDARPPERVRIDPAQIKNRKRAQERFERLRTDATQNYRRKHSGVVEVMATFYDAELYRAAVEYVAAKNPRKYGVDTAQRLLDVNLRDMGRDLEFYVKLVNYSSKPKITVPIGDVARKTTLVDEDGNVYEPVRTKGPKARDLVSEDSFTAWFSRTDSDGEEIARRAGRGNLTLVISELSHETREIRLPFRASRLAGRSREKAAAGPKGLMDKIKDMWK